MCVFVLYDKVYMGNRPGPADGMGKKAAMTNEQNEFLNVEHLSKSNIYISADCLVREINGFQS